MVDIDQRIKAEWRALGFYYELVENKNRNEWHFYGSRQGLQHFLELLDEYTNNPANDVDSEHQHYGPYNYLKIMTWHKPTITPNYIAGTITDLKTFRSILADKMDQTQSGQSFSIDEEYGADNTATLIFFVMEKDFDPVQLDKNYF
jgi:hypothetical protein